jgi:hypothetical protein
VGRSPQTSATVRFVPASVLSLSIAIGFVACGQKVANRNIDALNKLYKTAEDNKKALTIKEVEAVLGPPLPSDVKNFTITRQTTKEMPVVVYTYRDKATGQEIDLHFVENKLSNKVMRFGEKQTEDAELQRKMPPRPPAP